MKRLLTTLAMLAIIGLSANAQWATQTSGTLRNLWGVTFLNQNTGFVCGDSGTVLKTTNGGLNWMPKNTGTKYELAGMMFADTSNGYCISFSDTGTVLIKTTNGGNTWSDISLHIKNTHTGGGACFGADTMLLSFGGSTYSNAKILKTVNGGVSWDTVYTGGTGWISYMQFPDRKHGYATVSGSEVLKTVDGGDSWTLLPSLGGNLWMSGVYFINKDTGYVGGGDFSTGGGSIFETVNGGTTWQTLSTIYGTSVMLFNNNDTGYAVGSSASWSLKKIIKTTNGGTSWKSDTNLLYNINGITFPNANLGFAVGDSGAILKYSNALTGIMNEPAPNKTCIIYPNPASEEIKVICNQSTVTGVEIYNLLGEKVYQLLVTGHSLSVSPMTNAPMTSSPITINIADFPAGVYMVKVKTEKGMEVSKFVKE